MDKKSKFFFVVFGLIILGSIGASYYRYMVKRDYAIESQADCDPTVERCFVHVCDPDPNVDGDSCTGNLDEDTWYTKNINRIAYNIPNCSQEDKNCTPSVCGIGELGCSYTLCNEGNVPEGDTCNSPQIYNLAHLEVETTNESSDVGIEEDGEIKASQ